MPPAMKGRNKKHLQGQGIGLARDKRHEPPPRSGVTQSVEHVDSEMDG